MVYQCVRCDRVLEDPVERSAIYVMHEEMIAEDDVEMNNFDIRERGLSLEDLRAHGRDLVVKRRDGSLHEKASLEDEDLEDIAEVKRATVRVKTQKTGLVCKDCFKPDEDFRIWGTTREEDEEAERQALLARVMAMKPPGKE